ncbi:MAG: hypothetical protein HY820_31255 [Acidobacteria bacterium]|nr:hypothetical protein [Acidobacteriota bacterium]
MMEKTLMSQRCCVFQPFDHGRYDKRYDEIIAPAIQEAGLEPYRVDRDDAAAIPIDTLHQEIASSAICLADITAKNPNVMYEIGYAMAREKPVVLICCPSQMEGDYPFDLQHRGIVNYQTESSSDFTELRSAIKRKIQALLEKRAQIDQITRASNISGAVGLQPHEFSALAFIMAEREVASQGVARSVIARNMEGAGYTNLATGLALTRLAHLQMVSASEERGDHGEPYALYYLELSGQEWLLNNQHLFTLKIALNRDARKPSYSDDSDVPF